MHYALKFNQTIVSNTSKYNPVEGIGLKKPMQVLLP